MKPPRHFYQPLAIGAPAPMREIPVKLERMIHFVPPHIEKVTAKVPELAAKVDVVLGNLEDAIPMADKEAARAGLVRVANDLDFGTTQLWTRVNSLDSPWFLDDMIEIVTKAGEKFDVIMIPKVGTAADVYAVDMLVTQVEAAKNRKKHIGFELIIETALGMQNINEIAAARVTERGSRADDKASEAAMEQRKKEGYF